MQQALELREEGSQQMRQKRVYGTALYTDPPCLTRAGVLVQCHLSSFTGFSGYIMKTSLAFLSLLAAGADAFVPAAPVLSTRAAVSSSATSAVQHVPMRMGLNPELAANFPRDFAAVSACRLC